MNKYPSCHEEDDLIRRIVSVIKLLSYFEIEICLLTFWATCIVFWHCIIQNRDVENETE